MKDLSLLSDSDLVKEGKRVLSQFRENMIFVLILSVIAGFVLHMLIGASAPAIALPLVGVMLSFTALTTIYGNKQDVIKSELEKREKSAIWEVYDGSTVIAQCAKKDIVPMIEELQLPEEIKIRKLGASEWLMPEEAGFIQKKKEEDKRIAIGTFGHIIPEGEVIPEAKYQNRSQHAEFQAGPGEILCLVIAIASIVLGIILAVGLQTALWFAYGIGSSIIWFIFYAICRKFREMKELQTKTLEELRSLKEKNQDTSSM